MKKAFIYDYDGPIEPHQLRKEIAESQVQHRCTDQMAVFLLRIHDIVMKTTAYFRQTTREEEEESRSYSLERWLKRGLWTIDLAKKDNPFSYIYAGTYLNMVNRITSMRRKQMKLEQLQKEVIQQLLAEMPSMQVKDLKNLSD